jgi:ABC transporter DrrB family efflux protein
MTATLLVARRSVRKYLRTPQLIVVGTVQGAMFLLIFRYVFGGAIAGTGVSYVNFLVPGFVVTTVLFVGSGAAAGVAEDVEQGFVDRLRSLPISRLSAVAGRALADTTTLVWALAVTTAIGFAVGFRLDAHAAAAIAAFALSVLFGFAFAWVFICIGLFAGNAQAAQGMSLLVFPLTFVSSAYVPVASMPSWMRGVANNQPITLMTNAARALTEGNAVTAHLGHSTGYFVVASLIWAGALTLVFAPIAVWRYSRVNA